jgi:hypothetical protein
VTRGHDVTTFVCAGIVAGAVDDRSSDAHSGGTMLSGSTAGGVGLERAATIGRGRRADLTIDDDRFAGGGPDCPR